MRKTLREITDVAARSGVPGRRRGHGILCGLLAGALVALASGCSETTVETRGGGVWEGELVDAGKTENGPLAGTVTMASGAANTEVVADVVQGPSNEALGWMVGHGDCESPGDPLAAASEFGWIELDGSGQGEGRAHFTGGLSQEEHEEFAAAVFPDLDDRSEILACAHLTPVED